MFCLLFTNIVKTNGIEKTMQKKDRLYNKTKHNKLIFLMTKKII